MPSFNTEVAHTIGKEQATERLKGLLGEVRNKYKDQVSDLQEEWQARRQRLLQDKIDVTTWLVDYVVDYAIGRSMTGV